MLNLSTTKKWKFVDIKFTYKRQFGHTFNGQNGRVVKAMDCQSIGLCSCGFKSHLCRFFNQFYVVMDSNLQFKFSNPSTNLGKNWYFENLSHHLL